MRQARGEKEKIKTWGHSTRRKKVKSGAPPLGFYRGKVERTKGMYSNEGEIGHRRTKNPERATGHLVNHNGSKEERGRFPQPLEGGEVIFENNL